jgi:hypothetical protein
MTEFIGSYLRESQREDLALTIHADSFPVRWTLCSATADFLGAYCAGLVDDLNQPSISSLVFVANELIENAVKFNRDGDVAVSVLVAVGEAVVTVSNTVDHSMVPELRERFGALSQDDPALLLIRQVEANAEHPDGATSGLGLLLLMNDYGAKLGWKLSASSPDRLRLDSMARVPLKEKR